MGAEAVVDAALAAGFPLKFLMLSRNNISDESHERLRQKERKIGTLEGL